MAVSLKTPVIITAALIVAAGIWGLSVAKYPSASESPSQRAEWLKSEGILAFMEINNSLPKCSGASKAIAVSVLPDTDDLSISFDVACKAKLDFGPTEMKRLTHAEICSTYTKTALAEKGIVLMPRLVEKGTPVSSPFRIGPDTCPGS